MPAPVPVRAGTGVPFLDNASMPVWQASGVGADQVPNSGVHRAIFGGGGHASRQVEANVVRIAVSVYGDLLPSAASDPERPCSFSPHSRDSCIESTCHVSYRIPLLDAQGSAVSAVPPQKKSTQIGHLAADNREQFGVRAELAGRQLWAGAHEVPHSLIDGAGFDIPCGFCLACFRPLKYGAIGIFNAAIKHPMTKKVM